MKDLEKDMAKKRFDFEKEREEQDKQRQRF